MNDSPVDCQSRPRPARRRGIPYSAPRRRGLHLFATTFFVSQKTRRSPFRRSSSSEKRPFPPPRGFRPAGGVLFLFSPMLASLAKGQGQSHSIGWRALRAYLNSSFLIPHCPFRAPPPRRELRSFCVGDVSFCSSVPRLRRVKGQGLLRTSLVRDDVFCFSKNAPPLLRGPPFSALAALA